MRWSECLHARVGRTDSIALNRLMEFLFEYLVSDAALDGEEIASKMWRDYQRGGRHDKPAFLKDILPPNTPAALRSRGRSELPKRQARHNAAELVHGTPLKRSVEQ